MGDDELWRKCFDCLYLSSTSEGGKERMVNMYVGEGGMVEERRARWFREWGM